MATIPQNYLESFNFPGKQPFKLAGFGGGLLLLGLFFGMGNAYTELWRMLSEWVSGKEDYARPMLVDADESGLPDIDPFVRANLETAAREGAGGLPIVGVNAAPNAIKVSTGTRTAAPAEMSFYYAKGVDFF